MQKMPFNFDNFLAGQLISPTLRNVKNNCNDNYDSDNDSDNNSNIGDNNGWQLVTRLGKREREIERINKNKENAAAIENEFL